MNAVVALCHFCEMHGPSIVLCTQPIQRRDALEFLDPRTIHEDCHEEQYVLSRRPSTSGLSDCSEEHPDLDTFEPHDTLPSGTCTACRSFTRSNSGLMTHGDDADLLYLTLQFPHSPEVFTFLRQACVRSLSSEISPGREGPILFGDETHGYVYSYTFYLRDNEARGLQRWYSIVVLVMDKTSLMQSWPLLTRFSRLLVNQLQQQTEKTYEVDQAERPQRAARLGGSAAMNPENFRRQRRGKALRPLAELTASTNVFTTVHEHFTNLLQLGGNQMSETMLEGSPSCHRFDIDGYPVEEEDGECSHTNSVDKEQAHLWKRLNSLSRQASTNDGSKPDAGLTHDELFRTLPRYTGIVHLYQALGKSSFRTLAHNLISGNQIVVRGFHDFLVESVIRALEILIPPGCRKVVYFSHKYEDPWNCNILGLHPDAALPDHILSGSDYFVVDVLAAKMNEMNVDKYKIITPSQAIAPVQPSSYLILVERILEDPEILEEVVHALIYNQHERVMSKAKVLYKLFRTEPRESSEFSAVMDKLRIPQEDNGLLKFWMRALSDEYKAHLKELTTLCMAAKLTSAPPSHKISVHNSTGDKKVFLTHSNDDLKKSVSISRR